MYNNNNKRRFVTLVAIGIIAFLILGLLLLKDPDTPESATGQPQTTTPSNNSTPVNQEVTYNGINVLIEKGVTADQASGLKNAIAQYYSSIKKQPKQVSLTDIEHIIDPESTTTTQIMYFTLQADGVTNKARMEYFNLSNVRLYLYDKADVQIFDSGVITTP